jgi:pyridoxal phosphate enzyme (YggS family)
MIADNLQRIHDRITQTCDKAGRSPDSVALLAVSKTFGAEAVAQAHAAGQTAFGENYIQEAVEKITALAHLPLQWHCIGPIQSNKTRLVAEHFDWVQTIDRLKIAQRLSEQRTAPSGAAAGVYSSQHGWWPDQVGCRARGRAGTGPCSFRTAPHACAGNHVHSRACS